METWMCCSGEIAGENTQLWHCTGNRSPKTAGTIPVGGVLPLGRIPNEWSPFGKSSWLVIQGLWAEHQ